MNSSAKSIAGVLGTCQFFFARDPEANQSMADNNMKEFLNSSKMLPQSEFPYVGSDEMLHHLLDVINRQVFNANLDGIKLEWCDKLSSRAVIVYEQCTYATRQTYLRCSKSWFRNRSRQQFVEAILKRSTEDGAEICADLLAYLIHAGTYYFNARYKLNLVLNHNYNMKHGDDKEEVKMILKSIHTERKVSTGKKPQFTLGPQVKILSRRITGNMNAVKCVRVDGCGGFCGCAAACALRQMYLGSNIYFIFEVDRTLKCLLCENRGNRGTLDEHFNKDCKAFGRSKKNVEYDVNIVL